MDTNLFIYDIKTDDLYSNDISTQFDTCKISNGNPYKFPKMNKKVLGMIKEMSLIAKILKNSLV